MSKLYGVNDDWNGLINTFSKLDEAEKYYESVKETNLSDGVECGVSFVSITESDDDFETERELRKVIAVEDKVLTEEIGTPKRNGYEWDYWAEWQEVKL